MPSYPFPLLLHCIALLRTGCGTYSPRGWSCLAFLVVYLGHDVLGTHHPSNVVSSFEISSMRVAYSMTDGTPSCLMLSFMLIFLVRS